MSQIAPITVLMPVHNGAAFLREAIESVMRQTHSDLELLIINDGSTDESDRIIRSFTDKRIRYVPHDRNRGLVAVLNEGIDLAKGRYIARMDADDVMREDRLAKQFAFLEAHPEIAVVASFVDFINTDGEVTGVWDIDRATVTGEEIRAMMPRTNCIAHPSVMIRREALGVLRYASRQAGAEDWDLWMRMLARGQRIAKITEPLLKYRVHTNSVMSDAKKQVSLERRLLRARCRFLISEWGRLHLSGFQPHVVKAQVRTAARFARIKLNQWAHDLYRDLTYSPFALLREKQVLRNALRDWHGDQLLLFPYLNAGGAEQVHADIMGTVPDRSPLVIICGFSNDRAFEQRFAAHGKIIELPRLLNHPATRAAAHRSIAAKLNALQHPTLFSSNTTTFFELLPLLKRDVRTAYLQHAFLYQPSGNMQHKGWLRHFDRIDAYAFVSQHAKAEFEKFLFANNVPRGQFRKLQFISNAVTAFGEVKDHAKTGILFVGRNSPEKRLDLFLKLVGELEAAHPGRYRFTVVGSALQGRFPFITFKGIIHDPQKLVAVYADNDLLALTSTREGFPMVVMEAMAHGLVALSTPVGDVPNRLEPSFAFVTSAVEEPVVLKEMIAEIMALDADRERMHRMKTAALAKAGMEFDPQTFRERYRALLLGKASA